jgi:hypothetical protein
MQRSPAFALARGELLGDVLGVPPDPAQQRGGEPVQEEQAHEVQAGLALHHAAPVHRQPVLAEDRQVDPAEVRPEARAPEHGRHLHEAAVLQQRAAVAHPTVCGARWTPAAASSLGRTRSSGAAPSRNLGRTLRPTGVLTVSTCEANHQNGGVSSRSHTLSVRTGRWPVSGPDSQVGCVRATSKAISAPELPAPTTSTPPSTSWDGPRYRWGSSCRMPGSSSAAKAGILGRW